MQTHAQAMTSLAMDEEDETAPGFSDAEISGKIETSTMFRLVNVM